MSSRVSVRSIKVISALSLAACLAVGAGCGSAEEGATEPDEPAAAPAPTSTSSAGELPPAGPPELSSSPEPSSPSSPEPSAPSAAPTEVPAAPAAAGVGGAAAIDACEALGAADACGACVCGECRSELEACLGVPGCAEILACVRESGCSGRDCYCGEASLAECIRGEADGPCKEVLLAAPGGRAPSLEDGSGGPASDAALRVADCAEDDDVCADVCGLGD